MSLTVSIVSFSYKQALPEDHSGNGGGFLFDCRCLPNPGRQHAFKTQTGQASAVVDYLEQQPEVEVFFQHSAALVQMAVDNYRQRQFTHLLAGYGCTGGQHRSVYCAERLAERLRAEQGLQVTLNHLNRANWVQP